VNSGGGQSRVKGKAGANREDFGKNQRSRMKIAAKAAPTRGSTVGSWIRIDLYYNNTNLSHL